MSKQSRKSQKSQKASGKLEELSLYDLESARGGAFVFANNPFFSSGAIAALSLLSPLSALLRLGSKV